MGEFLENAIFGPKMFVFGYFRGGGKTIDLKNKVFGQVYHNIIGTKELKGSK